MKRSILPILAAAAALTLTSCRSQQHAADATTSASAPAASESGKISYAVARHYFLRNDVKAVTSPLVTSQQEFDALFGMAAVMGPDGLPTEIDFSKQNVIAVVLPETDVDTEIAPVSLTGTNGRAVFAYRVKRGTEHRSYTTRPLLLIAADKTRTADVTLSEVK